MISQFMAQLQVLVLQSGAKHGTFCPMQPCHHAPRNGYCHILTAAHICFNPSWDLTSCSPFMSCRCLQPWASSVQSHAISFSFGFSQGKEGPRRYCWFRGQRRDSAAGEGTIAEPHTCYMKCQKGITSDLHLSMLLQSIKTGLPRVFPKRHVHEVMFSP